MDQQQLGALALIACGILIAAGSGSAALWRYRQQKRTHEPLWSRLLATLATVGLVVGFMALGMYTYDTPFPQPLWPLQVAAGGFTAAIAGYGVTIVPTIWRVLWVD